MMQLDGFTVDYTDAQAGILPIDSSYRKGEVSQAFMQIGWMENDFRNLQQHIWTDLNNPIKSCDFSKFLLNSCMPPSQVALC